MQSLDERLRFAIINKRLVRITYHGAVRIGERHDYGIQRCSEAAVLSASTG